MLQYHFIFDPFPWTPFWSLRLFGSFRSPWGKFWVFFVIFIPKNPPTCFRIRTLAFFKSPKNHYHLSIFSYHIFRWYRSLKNYLPVYPFHRVVRLFCLALGWLVALHDTHSWLDFRWPSYGPCLGYHIVRPTRVLKKNFFSNSLLYHSLWNKAYV